MGHQQLHWKLQSAAAIYAAALTLISISLYGAPTGEHRSIGDGARWCSPT
eukprot:jgi/Botrbrau1/10751/Bobra.180_2s0016.1